MSLSYYIIITIIHGILLPFVHGQYEMFEFDRLVYLIFQATTFINDGLDALIFLDGWHWFWI